MPGFGAFIDGAVIQQDPFADDVAAFSADKPLMCGTCRDETGFFSLFGPPDVFSIDGAGLRGRLSETYQGKALDSIIATFRSSRPEASPAQLYFAITTSAIWRDSIRIAEAKLAQSAAPAYMYQLVYQSPKLVPATDFPMGSPHASDINIKFANTDKNRDFFLYDDASPERFASSMHMSAL